MKMTREEFKDAAMKVIAQQTIDCLGKEWNLFDSDAISDYGVVEYDDGGYDAINGIPLDEFLDELYEDIQRRCK